MVHFQADELPDAERTVLQAHVDGCPDCARRLEIEDGLLSAVRARIAGVPAPPGLETRVRAALTAEAPPSAGAWYRRPVWAVLATAALLAVLMLPGFDGARRSRPDAVEVEGRVVLVVDMECDRAGRNYNQQKGCRKTHHLNTLKTNDGRYWSFNLDRESHRKLLVDPGIRGHRLRVEGKFYPELRTLQMTQYTDLDAIPL
jgi:hypothetical protein